MPSSSHHKVITALAKQVAIDRQRYGQKDVPLRLFQRMFSRPLNEIEAELKNPALERITSIVGKKKANQTYDEIYKFLQGESTREDNQEGWVALRKGLDHKIQYIDFVKENVGLFGYKLAAVATGVALAAVAVDLLVSAAAYVFSCLAAEVWSAAAAPVFTLIAPTLPYLILGITIAAVAVVGAVLLVSLAEFASYKWHEKEEEVVDDFPNSIDLGL